MEIIVGLAMLLPKLWPRLLPIAESWGAGVALLPSGQDTRQSLNGADVLSYREAVTAILNQA